jgi:hypothetical protein
MAVVSILRDYTNNVSIVRMISTDDMAVVTSANYIENQMVNIRNLNNGFWQWYSTDMLLISCNDGNILATFTDTTFSSLTKYGSGTNLPTLTNGQLYIGSTGNPVVANTLTAGSGINITNGAGTITISTSGGGSVTAAEIQQQAFTYAVDTGTADNYIITLSPAPTSYTDGMYVCFVPQNSNTGNVVPSININGLGGASIFTSAINTPLGAPTPGAAVITANYPIEMVYSAFWSGFIITQINSAFQLYGTNNFAIGGNTAAFTITSDPKDTVCFGENITANNGQYALGVGNGVDVGSGQSVVAIGNTVTLSISEDVSNAIAVGTTLDYSRANQSISVGNTVTNNSPNSFALGSSVSITQFGSSNFVLGNGVTISGGNDPLNNFAMGSTVTIGNGSPIENVFNFGSNNTITGTQTFGFGSNLVLSGNNSVAFGDGVNSTAANIFASGTGVIVTNTGSWVIGDSNTDPVTDSASNQWNATFAGGYNWFINNTPTLSASIDASGNFINNLGQADTSNTVLTPTSGSTVTLATSNRRTILHPSGTLATLTIDMPASPVSGQLQTVTTTQTITALTVSGNGNSIAGAPTTLTASSAPSFTMIFIAGTWYPG